MHPYAPPPIRTLDQSSDAREAETLGPIREQAFKAGFTAGENAGYATGFAEGEKQAHAASEQELARLRADLEEQTDCNGVLNAFKELLAARTADRQALESETRAAMRTALEVLFPTLAEHVLGIELVALIGDSLTAHGPEYVTVRAAPTTIDAITARGLPQSSPAQLILFPDPNRLPGAAEITWSGGGMTFDPGLLLHQVNEVLAPVSLRKDEKHV